MASPHRAILSGALALGFLIQPCAAEEKTKARRLWKISVLALVAANALDFASSRGRMEANPLMRTPNGSFSWQRGLMVKTSVSAVTITMQMLMMRKSRDASGERAAAIVNLGSAAAIGGIAAHNLRVPKADTR
jgi:hypothetical protein